MTAPGSFDLALKTRLVYGEHSVDRLGELASEITTGRVLVVTDPGIVAAGHVERGEAALSAAGIEHARFEDVRVNPNTDDVEACLAFARDFRPNLIVGFGGGSSIDVAKGTNFLFTNGGRLQDYWGVGKATNAMLPLIAVPTTAGTGTETQSFALIADAETQQKMACGDPKAAARVAVLDPALTVTMPRLVTACTGLDTIGHAVETAVTNRRNPVSSLFSREAFRLAAGSFPRVLELPDNLGSRGEMILAAAFGGIAIENSMLGAAHSLANPLTARFGVAHGQAVAMMLPFVVRYNAADDDTAQLYAELARYAGVCGPECSRAEAVDALATVLSDFVSRAGLPTSLTACGIAESDCRALADEAARQWTAQFNPRVVTGRDLLRIYEQACAAA